MLLIFTDPPCMHGINAYPQRHDGTFKTLLQLGPEGKLLRSRILEISKQGRLLCEANQQPLFWAEVEIASQTLPRAIQIGRERDPPLGRLV